MTTGRTTDAAGDGDQWTYFVLPEAWRTEVCRGIDGEGIGRLGPLKREGKNLTGKVTIPANGRPRA
jgi:hypothetical protein